MLIWEVLNIMDIINLLSGDSKQLQEITNSLRLNASIIEYDESVIQMSNVESVTICEPPHKTVNITYFIFLLLGFYTLSFNFLFGLFIIALCGAYMYYLIWYNQNLGKNIYINLVSGTYLKINFKDPNFALEIVNVFKEYLNDSKQSTTVINIEKSNITFGDNSSILNKEDNNEQN